MKKILVYLIAFALVFSSFTLLAGCGGDAAPSETLEETADKETTEAVTESDADNEQPTEAEEIPSYETGEIGGDGDEEGGDEPEISPDDDPGNSGEEDPVNDDVENDPVVDGE